ncbi:Phenylalanyl-tRNA synthetase beta chain [Minicystis rosea]|nr:Phenylalanyl-tRNA synthetase beta chain [Minicystis rosea]
MKASYRWLSALLPGLSLSAQELADRFSSAGIAVDGIEEYGAGTAAIVVAEVKKIEPHPKREKLRLVTVDRGEGVLQQVVCGAPNVPDPGGLVCFAPLGTHLPAVNMTLVPRDIGGVVSEGMLCSDREMGLVGEGKSDDHGILILPAGIAKPGTPLREALPAVHDFIYELDLTPNRPDALGHIGLARDAAALVGLPFQPPRADAPTKVAGGEVAQMVSVSIEDTERCPHYGAGMVVDVTVGPSPLWLKYRLESLSVRSISNVVDITNLVMLEFGHPMHAFDFETVRGGKIVVRRAKEGEKLKTLDGVEHILVTDDLVIADGEGATALAGIMGGEGSEIRPDTKRVLLECAYFTTRGVRRSARRHGIHTDASHRFERGVDPADVPDVLAHASSLLTQLAGGKAVPGTILAGVPVAKPAAIRLRSARLDALVGAPVPFTEATQILERLGFGVQVEAGNEAVVTPPTHRPDIAGEADLIDEIVRVRGLDQIPTVLPAIRPQAPRGTGATEARVRKAALDLGLSEAVTFGFVSPKDIASLGLPPAPITLKNPLGEERSAMRTSLLPGLLDALRRARRHGVETMRLFTLGAKFMAPDPNVVAGAQIEKSLGLKSAALPDEVPSFAAVIAGKRSAHLAKPEDVDVYDAKGLVVEIVERVSGRKASVAAQPLERRATFLHPRGAGDVIVDGTVVGCFGPIHPDVADLLDLGGSCLIVEIDVRALSHLGHRTAKYQPIPVLPAATRDIALVVHDDVSAGAVGDAIREAAGALCESVELFDLFRGGQVPADHRSLAFHVVYRDPKAATDPEKAKTLTDEEVDKRHQAVVESVKQKFGAVLRG